MKDNFAKKAWISLLIILGSVIIASGAFYYLSDQIAAQSQKIVTERQEVAAQDNEVDTLADLEESLPSAASYGAAMNSLLPDQYGVVGLNAWLNSIGQKYGVTVSSALLSNGIPSLEATQSTPGSVGFSFSAKGPAGNVTSFLNDVESQSIGFLLTISSFNYTNDSSGETVTGQGVLFFR